MKRLLTSVVLSAWWALKASAQTLPATVNPLAEPPLAASSTVQASHVQGEPIRNMPIGNPLMGNGPLPAPDYRHVGMTETGPNLVVPPSGSDRGSGFSYSALAGESGGCANGRFGRSDRPWREIFSWESGCDACSVCGPLGRIWFTSEYLYWWTGGDSIPALVTTSTPGTTQALAGVLGRPTTQVLFGNDYVNDRGTNGLRLGAGGWFNRQQTIGFQVGYLQLQTQETSFNAASDIAGNPILARPFNQFNTGVADPAAQLIAFPGVFTGNIGVVERMAFGGWDAALRANLCCDTYWRIDGLVGFRYLRLSEKLRVNSALTALAGAAARGIAPGTHIEATEFFNTTNDFTGVDAGLTGEYRIRSVSIIGVAKAAYGYNNSSSDINGITTTTVGNLIAQNQGNLLALQNNIGNVTRSQGTIVPELDLSLAWDVTSNIRLKAGYAFIYMDRLFRPGGQIDQNVNTNLVPPSTNVGPGRPGTVLQQSDIAIHGITAGFELRY